MEAALDIFRAIAMRMDWLGQRQTVIADNIANSDTPEFLPRDLKNGSFQRALNGTLATVRPAVSHPQHIAARPGRDAAAADEQRDRYETAPSGNAVVLEEQLIKSAKTQADHSAMARLYKKHMQLLRMAVRSGGGG